MGWWYGTFVYAGIYGLGSGLIHVLGKPGSNGLKHLMCGTTIFCLWYMWSIMYWAQMFPNMALNPVLKPLHEGGDHSPPEILSPPPIPSDTPEL